MFFLFLHKIKVEYNRQFMFNFYDILRTQSKIDVPYDYLIITSHALAEEARELCSFQAFNSQSWSILTIL